MMEVEDPISAKFRAIVEALMIKTTSEIVKVFADVMLETRMEISRSWREIDDLKQELEQRDERREKQQVDDNCRSQTTQMNFKTEEDDIAVSPEGSMILESIDSRVQISEAGTVQKIDTRQDGLSVLEQATTEITTPETSFLEAQLTHLKRRQKTSHLSTSTSHAVSESQVFATETDMLSNSSIQALSTVSPQQSPSSTNIIILSKSSTEKGAVMSKTKYLQKTNLITQSNSVTRMLRNRQLLSSQKPCLCCSLDQCSKQHQKELKKSSPVTSCVYICTDCGARFQKRTAFKGHKCSSKLKCSRCGQTFTSLSSLASHNRHVLPTVKKPFPYKCYLCDHMFATQCGWNIHKRIHAHDHISDIVKQEIPSPSNPFSLPKELKTKVEVRLERISEAQLEAALFPKTSLLLDDATSPNSKKLSLVVEPSSSTENSVKVSTNSPMLHMESVSNGYTELVMKCQASSSRTELSESVKQSDDGTGDVFSSVSIKNQPTEKLGQSRSVTAFKIDSVEYNEGSSSASDDLSKGNSLSRKRKMSDCNHDIYNGVFPVEKIIRWRNTKGRNEVRIKWMPCSLCGAKWKNTWEPAESFISYKDGKHEDTVNASKPI